MTKNVFKDQIDNVWTVYYYLKALYDVARVINASFETEPMMAQIVEYAAQAMQVKACSLRILDSRKKRLLMGCSYGLSQCYE